MPCGINMGKDAVRKVFEDLFWGYRCKGFGRFVYQDYAGCELQVLV